jgi:dUTP pyrophosphatase
MSDDSFEPVQGTVGSAGSDLVTPRDVTITSGETKKIELDIAMEIPDNLFGLILDKSSMAKKQLTVSGGVLDSDYRGNISVLLTNSSSEPYTCSKGDKIAQIVFLPFIRPVFEPTEKLSETTRGHGGFGSTGKSVLNHGETTVSEKPTKRKTSESAGKKDSEGGGAKKQKKAPAMKKSKATPKKRVSGETNDDDVKTKKSKTTDVKGKPKSPAKRKVETVEDTTRSDDDTSSSPESDKTPTKVQKTADAPQKPKPKSK